MGENLKRKLGRSNIEVSAMGLGGWAIGGPFFYKGHSVGWGEVDDNESICAIHRAINLGINFFSTSDCFGAGHSEYILGKAFKSYRDKVIIATDFGETFNEKKREVLALNTSPDYIQRACRDSLRRLQTDYIDLYYLHIDCISLEEAESVSDELEKLCNNGFIRFYGWTTSKPEFASFYAKKPHCIAIQHELNVLWDDRKIVEVCENYDLANINRTPLAMGLLTGKYDEQSCLPKDDIRGDTPEWMKYFKNGKPNPEWLKKFDKIKEILTSDGRTVIQGALAWIWALSEKTIPIPGFKTVKQVEENAAAMQFGPLNKDQMYKIDKLLGR